jgi:diguanylate cyclase (GGDEF)-like protein
MYSTPVPPNPPAGAIATAPLATGMEPWTASLVELASQYVRNARAALGDMAGLLERLARHPQEAEAVQQLMRRFHTFAGSGATYGFPAVSSIAAQGESDCLALIAAHASPDAARLASWRALLNGLRSELAAGGPPPVVETALLAGEEEPRRRVSELAGVRILSMEDDPLQAAQIRAALEAAGAEVRWCADPQAFPAELAAFSPQLVLMDVMLPGHTGYDLVRSLRQVPATADLPVLFLTTQGQIAARLESAWAGGDEHLLKPLSAAMLLAAVTLRLERSRRVQLLHDHDELTRGLTRARFLDRAGTVAGRQAQDDARQPARWAMVEVDGLASIHERHGRQSADRVVAALAALLRRSLAGAVLGRYDAGTLAILLEGPAAGHLAARIEAARREFAAIEHRFTGRIPFRATFSAGVAALAPSMDQEAWQQAAARALAAAKTAGGNRVEQ